MLQGPVPDGPPFLPAPAQRPPMSYLTVCGSAADAGTCAYAALLRPLPRYAITSRASFSTLMADACNLWGSRSSAQPRNGSRP